MWWMAWCALTLTAPADAPVWLEAESAVASAGTLERLDASASDFGSMARDQASGEAFARFGPGSRLSWPARHFDAGEYACWVRAFAIDGRRAEVRVDHQPVGTSRGGPNIVALVWQRLGTITLTEGEHEVGLAAAADNRHLAYVDVVLFTTALNAIPMGKSPDDLCDPGPGEAVVSESFDHLAADALPSERWRLTTRGDQWARAAAERDRRCLRLHNGTGGALGLLLVRAVTPNASRQLQVSFTARRYGITETLAVEIVGVGSWSPMLRRDWTPYQRTFLVPPDVPGPYLLQITCQGGGDTLVDDVRVEAPETPVSAYDTGRFLGPPQLSREGRLFELERYVVQPDRVTPDDRDGDGRWALIRLGRDDNPQMFSRGTVLKSDSGATPPLTFRLTDLAPGPYAVWLGDPGRPVVVETAGRDPVTAPGGRQTPLGRIEVADGRLTLTVRQAPPAPGNPGPAYLDYVLLIPVENAAYTARPAPRWADSAADGVTRAEVGFALRRAGVAGGGVALPPGALGDPGHVRVLSGGTEVPSQTRCLCRWPDGSVKWLLVVAGPLPAGPGRLEYGSAVRPAPVADPVRVTDDGGLTVEAGGIRARFGGGLWSGLRLGRQELGALAGELVLDDRAVLRPSDLRWTVAERGPVRAVVRVDGWYAAGDRRPFRFELLVTIDRGAEAVQLEHTFIAAGDRAQEQMRALHLTFATPPGELSCPESGEARAASLRLLQDGSNPWALPDGAAYRLMLGDRELTGERARGVIRSGALSLAIDDFAQQWPIALGGAPGRLTAELWPRDAAGGPFVANLGMAKTHVLRLALGSPGPPVDWLRFDPAALRRSGAWGPVTATGEATAAYDAVVETAFEQELKGRSGYGMENWGDIFQGGYVAGVKTWSNQEWDLVQNWLTQYVRAGDPDYLDYADAAARHYADVDCVQAGPAAIVGGARTHCHTALIGHQLEGPNLAHAGWVEGLLNHYCLTGCERSLHAAVGIGDWIVRTAPARDDYPPSGPPYHLSQNRATGWPLTTLCLLYQHTRDPRLLTTARRIVDYLHRCQMPGRGCWEAMTPHELPWRGGCVFAFTIFRGLGLFAELTGEPEPAADRVLAGRWLLGELWRPGDRYLYEQCPAHEPGTDVGFLHWGSLADLTGSTGDPLYLLLALDGLDLRLRNPARLAADMARCQWGNGTLQQATRMLAVAADLGWRRPAELTLTVPEQTPVTAGGQAAVTVALKNGTAAASAELRGAVVIRGDWSAELTGLPADLPAGATAELRLMVGAPPPLEVVAGDNDTAYVHLCVWGKLGGQPVAVRADTRATAR